MKKILILTVFALFIIMASAQVSQTVNVSTAGTLTTIASAYLSTVTNLTVTGNIDARDVKTMRDNMPLLAVLNISAVSIKAYSGYDGTDPSSTTYYANGMPSYSFYNYSTGASKTTLKTIFLPASLTSIADRAFFGCSGITGSLTLPASITSIGTYAFCSCSGITGSLTLPASITSISASAFAFCTSINGFLTLPASLTSIGTLAFNGCSGIKIINCLNITPPTLGTTPFSGVVPIFVYVPSTAAATYKATSGWSSLNIVGEKRITFNNSTAGSLSGALINAGYGPLSSITHLTLTGNLNSTDFTPIKTNMTNLTVIDISGATIIDNALPANAFQNKTTLYSLTLPTSLTYIGEYAFDGCTNLLGNIPLPAAVTSIGNYAYQNCKSLTGSLTLPTPLTYIGASVFSGCSNLTGTLSISNIITSIGASAFSGCSGFTGTLTLPNTTTSIGASAFLNCTGFNGTLTLPNAITTVPTSTFSGCSGFTGILNIPLLVTSIAASAFNGLSKLTVLNISQNTLTIGDNAFNGCTGLTKISIPRPTPPTIYTNTFGGVIKDNCLLEVPTGSSIAYQAANYWKLFVGIIERNFNTSISIPTLNSNIKVYSTANEIIIEGTSEGELVSLFTINGKQLQSLKSVGERMVIPVKYNGVYMVKTSRRTFKMML